MSQSLAWWRATVLAAVVLCIALAVHASGQGGKTSGGFATVDFQKLTDKFKERDAVDGDLQAMRAKYGQQLSRRANRPDLPEADQKALDALYDKGPAATDADKAKIKEIEDKGDALAGQFKALTEKKDPTDADKQKMQEMARVRAASEETLKTLNDQLTTQFREYGTQQEDKLMTKIRGAVAKVAEQKGISIVFKTDVALYAGTDITQPVLDELNKGK